MESAGMYVLLAVTSAVATFLIVVVCSLCLRNRLKRLLKKSPYEDMFIKCENRVPYTPTLMEYQSGHRGDENENDSPELELICEEPQLDLSDTEGPAEPYEDRHVTPQSQTFEPLTAKKRMKMIGRSRSPEFDCEDMKVTFTVSYDETMETFSVLVEKVSNLPTRALSLNIYLAIYLLPRFTDGLTSRVQLGGSVVTFEEEFQLTDISYAELEKSTLRVSVFGMKKSKGANTTLTGSKDSLVGEVFLQCSEVNWQGDKPVNFDIQAHKKRLKRQSTSDKLLNQDLGELFILLQYQPMADRMKVLIRKADHLPKSDRLIGQPVHYVIINLLKGDQVFEYRETKAQCGYCPVWNQPFLLDIPSGDVDSYNLEFVIMRGRLYTKDGVIGHVIIGTNSSKTGHDHWQEVHTPRCSEVAKWHNIVPVFKY